MAFPDSSVGKESACNIGDPSSIPGSGRSLGEGIGYPLQYSWASLVAQLVKNPPTMQGTGFDPWVGKMPWRRERLPTPIFWSGEFHGLYSPWGGRELDTTDQLSLATKQQVFFKSNLINKICSSIHFTLMLLAFCPPNGKCLGDTMMYLILVPVLLDGTEVTRGQKGKTVME